ncbi:MAG: S8 family serine peptidase [Verrucomicrobiota bacterium]
MYSSLNTANGGKSSLGSDGCGYADSAADSANDVAAYSSRGPCSDGRQKPDLVAPGTHVVGGVPQSAATLAGSGSALLGFKASSLCALSGGGTAGNTNNFFPLGQQFYTVSSGTSHATPAVAGACALLRQYFLNANLAGPESGHDQGVFDELHALPVWFGGGG